MSFALGCYTTIPQAVPAQYLCAGAHAGWCDGVSWLDLGQGATMLLSVALVVLCVLSLKFSILLMPDGTFTGSLFDLCNKGDLTMPYVAMKLHG